MEVVGSLGAGRCLRFEVHLGEAVGRAGRHEPALTGGRVIQYRDQPIGRVVQRDLDLIPRAHEEVRRRIGRESGRCRVQRIGGRVWDAVPGDEGVVSRLDTRFGLAVSIVELTGQCVLLDAKERHGSAPLGRVAADPGADRDGSPAGRIELQLHKRHSWMVGAHRWIDDVLVTIRGTVGHQFGKRLRIAQCHAEPQRRVKLEIVGFSRG